MIVKIELVVDIETYGEVPPVEVIKALLKELKREANSSSLYASLESHTPIGESELLAMFYESETVLHGD